MHNTLIVAADTVSDLIRIEGHRDLYLMVQEFKAISVLYLV